MGLQRLIVAGNQTQDSRQVHRHRRRLPDEEEEHVGRRGVALPQEVSGGQTQRRILAAARKIGR